MGIGGVGLQAAIKRKPTKRCNRCGLRFPIDEKVCRHCSKFKTEHELEAFKKKIASQKAAKKNLGIYFLVTTLVLGLLLIFTF